MVEVLSGIGQFTSLGWVGLFVFSAVVSLCVCVNTVLSLNRLDVGFMSSALAISYSLSLGNSRSVALARVSVLATLSSLPSLSSSLTPHPSLPRRPAIRLYPHSARPQSLLSSPPITYHCCQMVEYTVWYNILYW